MKCAACGDPTDAIYLLCDPCLTRRVDDERTAQGLPLEPSDETMERLARVLAPAAATSRGAG
jgi:hypothetical protein